MRRWSTVWLAGLATACTEPPREAVVQPAASVQLAQREAVDPRAPQQDPPRVAPRPQADAQDLPPTKTPALDLVFVGDIVLGEYFLGEHRSFAGSEAPGDAFDGVADLLKADVVVGNLESPVVSQVPDRSPYTEGHRFGGSASTVDGLAAGGFNVMSVANNHATDLLGDGLQQTPALLRERGITPVGSARHDGSPFRIETVQRQGWDIAFVAATTWVNHRVGDDDPKLPLARANQVAKVLTPLIREAAETHDLVIVLLHWGQELRERPNVIQIHGARALIDAGANLVIGHHPHVLQGVERYHGGLIAYSLGNFLFPAWNEVYRDSAVLRARFTGQGCLESAAITPVRLARSPAHTPEIPEPRYQRAILTQMRRLGRGLQTRWQVDGDSLQLQTPTVCTTSSGTALESKAAPPESVTGLR